MKILFNLIALVATVSQVASTNPEDYSCGVCLAIADEIILTKSFGTPMKTVCQRILPGADSYCDLLDDKDVLKFEVDADSSRKMCQYKKYCPEETIIPYTPGSGNPNLDIRVAKGLGTRPYNEVRLTVISNKTLTNDVFTYSKPFTFKWMNSSENGVNILNTGIATVTPGKTTSFLIDGQKVDILIPVENAGTRGIIISDPCFQSNWVGCAYKDSFNTFTRMTSLLNAAGAHDDFSFFDILGDNFYDQDGDYTAQWFNALSLEVKSKVLSVVPGNHDFWVLGSPAVWTPKDQLGNGFMQFYGQDALSSKTTAGFPYNFTVSPTSRETLPSADNFFFYNKLGNIGVIAYSGAHDYSDSIPMFEEACQWATVAQPEVLLLLGHWNSEGLGCLADSTVPAVYTALQSLPACAAVKSKIKFFEGHTHCNYVPETNNGFMIGGCGMSDTSCSPIFGFNVIDTTDDKVTVYYFNINEGTSGANKVDNYAAILSCIQAKGVSGCYDLAQVWASQTLPLA